MRVDFREGSGQVASGHSVQAGLIEAGRVSHVTPRPQRQQRHRPRCVLPSTSCSNAANSLPPCAASQGASRGQKDYDVHRANSVRIGSIGFT